LITALTSLLSVRNSVSLAFFVSSLYFLSMPESSSFSKISFTFKYESVAATFIH
jgi:hypothetical protein